MTVVLETIAKQKLSSEMTKEEHVQADFEDAYNEMVEHARALMSCPKAREIADNRMTTMLSEVIDVLGNRSLTHGAMRKNMEQTAKFWSAYLGVDIKPDDVPQMIMLLKVSRRKLASVIDPDHTRDMAGYSAITWELMNG